MKNQAKRPVNLNLFRINLPVTALLSILHRISGFAVFISFLFVIWLLDRSLFSEESFLHLTSDLNQFSILKLFSSLILLGYIFHVVVGIKKMLGEFFGVGESLETYKRVSRLTLLLIIFLYSFLLIYLW